ncbi:PRC-barrel domain-containing protein [Mesorhizobium sp. LHD-90]|uniref:PRC-barrel domain-containing protein n=1 Tax=Mesorhizobium sp. LHD-90 TaxID=3071414 RepID=UPI0027DFE573|nr:PRC-barrel domain-containing protein [Mesorhizobium sp. LHD-90]MDQ6433598.1 PRC-barrel domain-containing protein [Mesorhizobium sp. LHD-90]
MVRKLLATTAIVTLLTGAAFAQEATTPAPAAPATEAPAAPVVKSDGFLATNLIGETVYNGTADDAENIGSVNDVVIGSNGQIEAVVVGVGGFLGIGEKNVAMNYSDIKWAEKDGDRWIVVNATKDQLQALAEFDRRPFDPAPAADTTAMAPAPADTTTAPAPADTTAEAPTPPADDTMAEAPADTTAPAPADETALAPAAPAEDPAQAPADTTAQAPADTTAPAPDQTTTGAIDKSTLTEMPAGDIRSEELVGTTVYGANDADLGEIGDVVLTRDGKVDAIIIDVGGFLGVGEKEVAIGMDNLAFMTDKDGNKYLYTTFTKEQLDAAAAYDKSTWAEKRDDQRIIMMQ